MRGWRQGWWQNGWSRWATAHARSAAVRRSVSMVVGWQGAHNSRFCVCSLCATQWNYVRIKCTLCSSTKGISYREVEGGDGTIWAETCKSCRGYVKILHQHKNIALDPVADDVASLALDLLLREREYRRGSVNPYPARLLR